MRIAGRLLAWMLVGMTGFYAQTPENLQNPILGKFQL
jgi:hypothetical protein